MGKLKDRYIRFDWAIKRLLRDKANFAVLEGLLTVLFEDKTQIVEILESEGNQLAETDKFNRVDIKAKNSKGEIILVEVQNTREVYYLERILYGVAKTITEHISLPRTEPFYRRAYFRRTANLDQAGECHPAQVPKRDFPGILHHTRERVRQGSKDATGRMG